MSPLEITTLLRLHARAYPLDDMPREEATSEAMKAAFSMFKDADLLNIGASHADVMSHAFRWPFLTEKGSAVVRSLCEVKP